VLTKLGLETYHRVLTEHIYQKRKPLSEWRLWLAQAGLPIQAVHEDYFHYRFADGSALLNHFFMKLAFLPPWKNVVPEEKQEEVFTLLENRLNQSAGSKGICMQVPFVTVDCRKEAKPL
jgi:arsenite methyltransferase